MYMLFVSTIVLVLGGRICTCASSAPHPAYSSHHLQVGDTYCEKTDCCYDTPVLRACETLDGATREAGFGDGAAAPSVELLGRHYNVGVFWRCISSVAQHGIHNCDILGD